MNVFLAGGAGYIGSHTAVELLNSGHEIQISLYRTRISIKDKAELITVICGGYATFGQMEM